MMDLDKSLAQFSIIALTLHKTGTEAWMCSTRVQGGGGGWSISHGETPTAALLAAIKAAELRTQWDLKPKPLPKPKSELDKEIEDLLS